MAAWKATRWAFQSVMSHLQKRKRWEEMRGWLLGAWGGAKRSRMTMLLDREWRRRAVARPIPELPPVIRTVLLVRLVRIALSIVNVFVAAIFIRTRILNAV